MYYINMHNLQIQEKAAEAVDDAYETKEAIGKYQIYVSTLKLMHQTNMIVKRSSDAGEGKNALIADALTLGEKCLSTARETAKNILTAQAGALMARIQLQELEPLDDPEKEKERLE